MLGKRGLKAEHLFLPNVTEKMVYTRLSLQFSGYFFNKVKW